MNESNKAEQNRWYKPCRYQSSRGWELITKEIIKLDRQPLDARIEPIFEPCTKLARLRINYKRNHQTGQAALDARIEPIFEPCTKLAWLRINYKRNHQTGQAAARC